MVSFIITTKERLKRESYITELAQKHNISAFDITIIDKEAELKATQSIGLETVKLIKKKLFLKPMQGETKLLVIEDAHILTPEAQNALLKLLEEPPDHTIIALCADSAEALLPTIRSRCAIIALTVEKQAFTTKEQTEFAAFIESLPILSAGEKLKHAEKLAKDKDKALVWIEKLILQLREKVYASYFSFDLTAEKELSQATVKQLGADIRLFQKLHTTLKETNINTRLAIENTLLSV